MLNMELVVTTLCYKLILDILNSRMYYTPLLFFYPVNLQISSYMLVFTSLVESSVDPDQMAS